jgi:hypothetical protein
MPSGINNIMLLLKPHSNRGLQALQDPLLHPRLVKRLHHHHQELVPHHLLHQGHPLEWVVTTPYVKWYNLGERKLTIHTGSSTTRYIMA